MYLYIIDLFTVAHCVCVVCVCIEYFSFHFFSTGLAPFFYSNNNGEVLHYFSWLWCEKRD